MDKIGILTFHRSENYGSVLQAWALCQQINTLPGCQAELIDYSNRAQQDLYALFLPPKSVKNIAKNLRACLLLPYLLRRKAAFRDFIGALPKSAPMQTEADFAAHRADYRAVVCGSDQIWNPGSLDFSTLIHSQKKTGTGRCPAAHAVAAIAAYKDSVAPVAANSPQERINFAG